MKQRSKNAIAAFFYGKKNNKNSKNALGYEVYLSNNGENAIMTELEYSPLISVFVSDADKKLKASLGKQTYLNWELVNSEENVNGDFVLLLTDDCVLTNDALFSFAEEINKNAYIDMLYADEDEMSLNNERSNPFFKPDYSETTLLSYNCIGIPVMISKKVFSQLAKVDMSDEDALYSTALSCVAHSSEIIHIKKVLASRTKKRGIVSTEGGLSAIKAYLQLKRRSRLMEEGLVYGTFRVSSAKKRKSVLGIVILSGKDIVPLRRLLESIEECIFNIPKKIVVVSYGINDAKMQAYCRLLEESKAVRVLYSDEKNYSKLCNMGAAEADCDVLLFLDPAMELISPIHIKNLMDSVEDGRTGAVGCKILNSEGKIYECGITVGLFGTFGSLYRGEADDKSDEVKNRFINVKRSVSAVSSLCFMISCDTFYDAGGFDETIENTDAAIEFSLRLGRKGLDNIYEPFAVMIKHDDGSAWERSEADEVRMYGTLRPMLISGDPFYNPNYDYSSKAPQIVVTPYPPIELNPNYNK